MCRIGPGASAPANLPAPTIAKDDASGVGELLVGELLVGELSGGKSETPDPSRIAPNRTPVPAGNR